jgi:predicted RNA binding protein YcfA (HicA-like mRNA interferase family)
MSPRSPVLKPREVLRALLRAGFEIIIKPAPTFNYDTPTSRISELPYLATTNFDLPPSVLKSILRQAEMTREDFLDAL